MLDVLKYLRGYLRIRVTGFSPERFMNLCSNKDILLWDITQEKDGYVLCISLRSFYRLRSIVRKTGTRVVIMERCGLPFFVPALRKRKVFLAGSCLAIAFWYVSSLFVWDIDVKGNYRITEDVLESFLEERGIREGMRRQDLDINAMEKELRREFPLITWTSAKLEGTRLLIEIKENDAPILGAEEAPQVKTGTDLVAEFDGTVVSMIVRSGVPQVHIGDAVERGTLLVDGKVPVYNEDATLREYIYTDADADIVLEHDLTFQTTLPFDYVQKEYTGRAKVRHFLRVGDGWEGKMPLESPFLIYDRVMDQSRPLLFEKLDIPIFYGTYTYQEYQNVEHEYRLEEAEERLREKLMSFLSTLEEKGVQIIEKNVKIDTSDKNWILQGEFRVLEKAGKRIVTDRGEQTVDE